MPKEKPAPKKAVAPKRREAKPAPKTEAGPHHPVFKDGKVHRVPVRDAGHPAEAPRTFDAPGHASRPAAKGKQ